MTTRERPIVPTVSSRLGWVSSRVCGLGVGLLSGGGFFAFYLAWHSECSGKLFAIRSNPMAHMRGPIFFACFLIGRTMDSISGVCLTMASKHLKRALHSLLSNCFVEQNDAHV